MNQSRALLTLAPNYFFRAAAAVAIIHYVPAELQARARFRGAGSIRLKIDASNAAAATR